MMINSIENQAKLFRLFYDFIKFLESLTCKFQWGWCTQCMVVCTGSRFPMQGLQCSTSWNDMECFRRILLAMVCFDMAEDDVGILNYNNEYYWIFLREISHCFDFIWVFFLLTCLLSDSPCWQNKFENLRKWFLIKQFISLQFINISTLLFNLNSILLLSVTNQKNIFT